MLKKLKWEEEEKRDIYFVREENIYKLDLERVDDVMKDEMMMNIWC